MTTILTINAGSSSIKFATFASEHDELRRIMSGRVERIGLPEARFTWRDHSTGEKGEGAVVASDHRAAMAAVLERLEGQPIAAIGHRIVHGGDDYSEPVRIDGEVMDRLARLEPLAPEHMPAELGIVRLLAEIMPHVPQVACFDTAFHQAIPHVARLIAVPREWQARGVKRYGFHGLSYEYVVEELRRCNSSRGHAERLIIAHLGNGASMAAVRNGKCIDTSMAFSPCAGLVMGTRTGDLDPGVAWYMMKAGGLDADTFFEIANHRSGLLGLSGIGSDMRDLLAARGSDSRAAEAVALFCYTARKWIGAFTAALGGLETLVFTGGIGENAPIIREEICTGLDCIGIRLSKSHNDRNAPVISSEESRVVVRVVHTDEESLIARKTFALLESA